MSVVVEGIQDIYFCKTCKRVITYALGDIRGILDKEKGTKWSDVLGCGHFPFLIISDRVLEAFIKENVSSFPYHRVFIEKPYPKRLDISSMPDYYWIDGSKMLGAKLDFKESGFVDNRFCPECSTRTDNIEATYDLHSRGFSYVFKKNTWDGSDLFVTDISRTRFFCTDKVVKCAQKYKLTNFNFVPIEKGNGMT